MWANLQKVKYSLVQLHHSMTMLNRLQKHPAPKVRKTDGAKLKPKSCFNLWYEAKERDLGTSVSQISCQCVMQHTFAVLGALTLFWWSMLNRCRKKKQHSQKTTVYAGYHNPVMPLWLQTVSQNHHHYLYNYLWVFCNVWSLSLVAVCRYGNSKRAWR